MTLLWPELLVLLAALPLLVVARIWALRRRRTGVRFSSLSLVRAAIPRSSRVRRHLPFALFLVGLGSLVIAMARPAAIVAVPDGRASVVLAMDVSRSMCSTDIPPNRLAAAEQAASSFVQRQSQNTRIGIVAFAGYAQLVQAPTNDDEVLLDVIGTLATGRRTAIGSAILESIDALAEIDPSIAKSVDPTDPSASCAAGRPEGRLRPGDHRAADRRREQRRPGSHRSGEAGRRSGAADLHDRLRDREPRRAAAVLRDRQRARRQRPVRPGRQLRRFGGGGFGGTGGGFRRAIDENTLNAIADATGGKYYPAESAEQLNDVFQKLPTNLIVSHEVVEVSVAFVAIGTVLLALAILLGQRWRPLP